jgi:hypothetical protein
MQTRVCVCMSICVQFFLLVLFSDSLDHFTHYSVCMCSRYIHVDLMQYTAVSPSTDKDVCTDNTRNPWMGHSFEAICQS